MIIRGAFTLSEGVDSDGVEPAEAMKDSDTAEKTARTSMMPFKKERRSFRLFLE